MIDLAAHSGHRSIHIETSFLRECIDCEETYDPTLSLSGMVEQAERRGAVKALRSLGDKMNAVGNYVTASVIFGEADEYENGADW